MPARAHVSCIVLRGTAPGMRRAGAACRHSWRSADGGLPTCTDPCTPLVLTRTDPSLLLLQRCPSKAGVVANGPAPQPAIHSIPSYFSSTCGTACNNVSLPGSRVDPGRCTLTPCCCMHSPALHAPLGSKVEV